MLPGSPCTYPFSFPDGKTGWSVYPLTNEEHMKQIKLTDWQVLAIEQALKVYKAHGQADGASLQALCSLITKADHIIAITTEY